MTSTLVVARDYKYSDGAWAAPLEESFQLISERRTDFTVLAGYITEQTESTYEFYDRTAPSSETPEAPPPYYFADGTFRVDPAFTLQLTSQKKTSYAASGIGNITVITSTFDPATQTFDLTSTTLAGNAPRATTINSAFTSLVQQPQAGTLIDDCIDGHYVPGKVGLSLEWAESQTEMATAIRRQMQRDSAIVRRLKLAANPLMRIGHTYDVIVSKRAIDARHMLVGRKIARNLETGGADMWLTLEYWIR